MMKSIGYFLAVVLVVLLALAGGAYFAKPAEAQTAPLGLTFASTLAGCQSVGQNTLCLFGSSTTPSAAVSMAGGAFVALTSAAPPPPAGVTTFNGRSGAVVPALNDYSFAQLAGALTAAQMPAAQKCNLTLTLSSPTTGTSTNQLSGTAQFGGCQ
jgi:hypothetical protein